ncbi:hypothetical protein NBRC116593_29100 [Sulfitobacter pacificus]
MSHIEFMQYLQSQAGSDAQHKPVTRLYKNNAGTDVMIHLPQSYWDYVDWSEARGDIDFSYWVTHTEQNPFEDWTLSRLLMYWLWLDECRRHRLGHETPTDTPPEGYEAFGERSNDG